MRPLRRVDPAGRGLRRQQGRRPSQEVSECSEEGGKSWLVSSLPRLADFKERCDTLTVYVGWDYASVSRESRDQGEGAKRRTYQRQAASMKALMRHAPQRLLVLQRRPPLRALISCSTTKMTLCGRPRPVMLM